MEKSRVQKFKDGDRNTSYFHRIARIKASYKVIHMLRHIDQYFNTPESIEDHVVNTPHHGYLSHFHRTPYSNFFLLLPICSNADSDTPIALENL